MTQTQTGWTLLVVSLGMMCTLLSGDIANLHQWRDASDPAFVGGFIAHLGAVITAFVGGKMLPTPTVSGLAVDLSKVNIPRE